MKNKIEINKKRTVDFSFFSTRQSVENLSSIEYFYSFSDQEMYEKEVENFSNLMEDFFKKHDLSITLVLSELYENTKIARKIKSSFVKEASSKFGHMVEQSKQLIVELSSKYIIKTILLEVTTFVYFSEIIKYFFTGTSNMGSCFLLAQRKESTIPYEKYINRNLYTELLDRHRNLVGYLPNFERLFNLSNFGIYCFYPYEGGEDIGTFSFITNFGNVSKFN